MDNKHHSISQNFEGTNVLLAPNGKPSNLTPEQYNLVRTPQFKKWFGDWERLVYAKVKDPAMDEVTLENLSKDVSKVVDENGEPLVVYHWSKSDFHIFEYRGYSQGFFFTTDKNDEVSYRGSYLITAFLNIRTLSQLSNIPKKKFSVPMFENQYIEESQKDKQYQSQKTWDGTIFKGYPNSDGIKFIRDDGKEFIVAFEPNQIKLADGSNTTFDGSNPDIRFENGGEVEDLINKGIVDLKMYDTTPEHAREYGLDSLKPLYIQTIFVDNDSRLRGIGKKVLAYIDEYANKNGNDVVFGHITQKGEPSVDAIKMMLRKNGYSTIEGNNDFYKYVNINSKFDNGGEVKYDIRRNNYDYEHFYLVDSLEEFREEAKFLENERVVFKYKKFFEQGWNKEFINCKKLFSYSKIVNC